MGGAGIGQVVSTFLKFILCFLSLFVSGSAAASALAEVYICVFLYAYIRWKRLHAETWGGEARPAITNHFHLVLKQPVVYISV